MNIKELAKQAGLYVGENLSGVLLVGHAKHNGILIHLDIADLERFTALVRAKVLEEAARKRAKPPRKLPRLGTGALWDEQQCCYELGYREGAAAVRAAIRALKEKA